MEVQEALAGPRCQKGAIFFTSSRHQSSLAASSSCSRLLTRQPSTSQALLGWLLLMLLHLGASRCWCHGMRQGGGAGSNWARALVGAVNRKLPTLHCSGYSKNVICCMIEVPYEQLQVDSGIQNYLLFVFMTFSTLSVCACMQCCTCWLK